MILEVSSGHLINRIPKIKGYSTGGLSGEQCSIFETREGKSSLDDNFTTDETRRGKEAQD